MLPISFTGTTAGVPTQRTPARKCVGVILTNWNGFSPELKDLHAIKAVDISNYPVPVREVTYGSLA